MRNVIAALVIGRAGSVGFPAKNLYPILGRPLAAYPLMAARRSRYIDRLYVSTDSAEIAAIGRKFGAELIERPASLATKAALGEHAFQHGYQEIVKRLAPLEQRLELIVLLFANAATLSAELIDRGIEALRADERLDSAVTVSEYNMWSPLRARRVGPDGCLQPFVPFEVFGDPRTLSCDRDSQGSVYFADMGLSVVRPRCLDELEAGLLPQKWMGQKIHPIVSWGGCDIDFEWQVPMVEFWLRKHGFSEAAGDELA
jgi:hypothetical protein